MQQQLGFDALHLRRVHDQLQQVLEQGLFDFMGRAAVGAEAGQRKGVADDGLGLLVNAEGVADDLAVLQGRIAGQRVAVQVLRQQLGRGVVVPVQPLDPQRALGLQHRKQHRRGKVPQVEDLDGRAGSHGFSQWTVDSGQRVQ